jgi:hypothetical protein
MLIWQAFCPVSGLCHAAEFQISYTSQRKSRSPRIGEASVQKARNTRALLRGWQMMQMQRPTYTRARVSRVDIAFNANVPLLNLIRAPVTY